MLGKLQFELQKLVDKYVSFSDLVLTGSSDISFV